MSNRTLHHFRSVFISDVHLGFRGATAAPLLQFLNSAHIERLFLLGDIVDLESMRRSLYWPRQHNEVLSRILRLAASGTRVVYVPGNHDADLRAYAGGTFGGVQVEREHEHRTFDGRRLWLIHGDAFDGVVKCSPALAWLGTKVYDLLLAANPLVNGLRRFFGCKPASLAAFLKSRVPSAMAYIERFECAVAYEAGRRGFDGVVCGHIHRPMLRRIDGVLYCNDGDWVESCSMLVEDSRGALRLLNWPHATEGLHADELEDDCLVDAA
ncbi:MAG: UDP-2,3-diacylglucosamine diphosphatase [Steroidobacteraceae bacterium]